MKGVKEVEYGESSVPRGMGLVFKLSFLKEFSQGLNWDWYKTSDPREKGQAINIFSIQRASSESKKRKA